MSYSAGDVKWGSSTLGTPSGEITWTSDIASGLDYNTSLYDQGDFDDALQAAFDSWEAVAAIDFTYTTSTNVDVDVTMASLAGSTIGLASYSFYDTSPLDTIFEAGVTLDSDESWAPYGGGALDFFAVSLHEIGHILGLDHVDHTSDIMNAFISTDELGDGDISGVQYLYGSGGAEEPPGEDPPGEEEPGGGGGGGGGAGALVGLLAAIFAILFGGFGGAVAIAAVRAGPEEDDDTHDDDILLADIVPVIEADNDGLYVSENNWLEDDEVEEIFL